MPSSKIDKRKAKDIEDKIMDLVPYYLPNWRPEPGEPGWAVAQAFSKMAEDIIERLNQVPERLFMAYLDKLGTKISPPLPSKTPVTFYLSEGVPENKTIPAKVRVATGDQVIFETEKEFAATTAKLNALLSVNPNEDTIYDHSEQIQKGNSVTLLSGKSLQEHSLYIGDDYLLNLNRGFGKGLYVKLTVPFIENCTWQYWGQDEKGNEDWREFKIELRDGKVYLRKELPYPTSKKVINRQNTYWIRAILKSGSKEIGIPSLKVEYESKSGVDALFYNDVPIDVKAIINKDKSIYPFGPEPKLQDTFYIASNEAFSKKSFDITLKFFVQEKNTTGKIEYQPEFSWEYWDGTGWRALSYEIKEWYFDYNSKKNFFPISLTFACPDDIEKTQVNGEENYWIRVRLIGGGYGKYYMENNNLIAEFNPPKISSISIYVNKAVDKKSILEHVFSYNNLNYDKLRVFPAIAFSSLPDKNKTLYLGFDNLFNEGLITLFFSLSRRYWEIERYLEWNYYSKDGWKPLNVKDETNGLTQSGICEFIAPSNQDMHQKFDKSLYWIKIELVEKETYKFFVAELIKLPALQALPMDSLKVIATKFFKNPVYASYVFKTASKSTSVNSGIRSLITKEFLRLPFFKIFLPKKKQYIEPCPPDLIPFHPALHIPTEEKEYQIKLNGIYPNTVWATQSETIADEIVGSSDGSPNQKFSLLRAPVIELKLWVKELLQPKDSSISSYKDEEAGFWVLWKGVDDLAYSYPTSRHYTLDNVTGEIQVGDGKTGLIPPIGKDNIKATYKTGGGKKGNVPEGKIKSLVTSVASVDKVKNHEAAAGGADVEDIDKILVRSPKKLKTRSRAIAIEDYELLTKEASTEIAKVKIIPNTNNFGQYQPNWVTIVIVPESKETKPTPSKGLIRNVENYIKTRCPLTNHIQVIPPVYAKINVETVISIKKWDLLSSIKKEVQQKIASFIHPLYGGIEGKGWDFGMIPCYSDFFLILSKIAGIDYIKQLKIIVTAGDQKAVIPSEKFPVLDVATYVLVFSGAHNITLEGE